jgi:ligand-binding sensor domain-containing protein
MPADDSGAKRRKAVRSNDLVPSSTPNRELFLDSRDRLWFGTNGDALYSFDNGKWIRFAEAADLHPDNAIDMVAEDAMGRIWVASSPRFVRGKGYLHGYLHRWDGKGWKHWNSKEGFSAHSLQFLQDGTLAVGSNGGLFLLEADELVSAKTEESTSPHFVYSLSEDAKGRLWIAHLYWGNGVTVFDGRHFHTVDSRDGLFADRIKASAHDAAGRVWLLADDGRVGVYEADVFERKTAPIKVESPDPK